MHELSNHEDYYIKEIIDGQIYYMAPGISAHLIIITKIGYKFNRYFENKNKKCMAHTEGLEVYLDANYTKNFVVPDISIICDNSKFGRRGYKGAPELIVEVISQSTASKDRGAKFKAYEKASVKEYWIVSPKEKSIDQYVLKNGKYEHKDTIVLMDEIEFDKLTEEQKSSYSPIIRPSILDDLEIDLNEIFDQINFID